MVKMGDIYKHIQMKHGPYVEVEIIDPRNSVSFFAIILREKRNRNLSWRTFINSLLFGLSKQSILINGYVFSKGILPNIEELDEYINRLKQGAETT